MMLPSDITRTTLMSMSNKVISKSGRALVMPTPQEDSAITKSAISDADAKPLTDAEWEAVRPVWMFKKIQKESGST